MQNLLWSLAAGNHWPRAYTVMMWGQPSLVRQLFTVISADKAAATVSNVCPGPLSVLRPNTSSQRITAGHDENYLLKVSHLSDDLHDALLSAS